MTLANRVRTMVRDRVTHGKSNGAPFEALDADISEHGFRKTGAEVKRTSEFLGLQLPWTHRKM